MRITFRSCFLFKTLFFNASQIHFQSSTYSSCFPSFNIPCLVLTCMYVSWLCFFFHFLCEKDEYENVNPNTVLVGVLARSQLRPRSHNLTQYNTDKKLKQHETITIGFRELPILPIDFSNLELDINSNRLNEKKLQTRKSSCLKNAKAFEKAYRPCRILSVVFSTRRGGGICPSPAQGAVTGQGQVGTGGSCPGPGWGWIRQGWGWAVPCPGPGWGIGWGQGGGTLSWSWQGYPLPLWTDKVKTLPSFVFRMRVTILWD